MCAFEEKREWIDAFAEIIVQTVPGASKKSAKVAATAILKRGREFGFINADQVVGLVMAQKQMGK